MKFVNLIIFFLWVYSFELFAMPSMRNCTLLPIKDELGGAISFKVFEEVETYLKEGDWCVYKSNSELLNILSSYKKNLSSYLENPKVLKIISEKLNSGSMIRVKIENHLKGVLISTSVIGENGEDIYFKEKISLKTHEVTVISQTIRNWLDVYEKTIPYDGRIVGVLGNQFTVDVGSTSGLKENAEILVTRPLGKKRHPLLKEVVDWETIRIGKGKIFHSDKYQSQGKMTFYDTKKRLKIDDWVLLAQVSSDSYVQKGKFEKENEFSFGKLGEVSLFFGYAPTSTTISSTTTKKIAGSLIGIDLETTLWVTRDYWLGLDISRSFGTLKKKEGEFVNSSNSLGQSAFSIKAGYKYLPMGFFYGPQVDVYLSYSSYKYGFDNQTEDGLTEFSFKGLGIGARGILPIQNIMKFYLNLHLMLGPGYSEDVKIYGEDDSTSHYKLGVGGSYLFGPNMTIDGGIDIISSKAKFHDPTRSVRIKNSVLRVGTTFTF